MTDFEQAKTTAFAEIARLAAHERANGLEVGTPGYVREQDEFWTFGAALPKLQAEGWAPGAILVSVDKRDGHIWTDEDFERLAEKVAV